MGEHLDVMVRVFREVRRVLKPLGTCWINYGDCYATKPNGRSAAEMNATGNDDRTFRDKPFSTIGPVRAPIASFEVSDQSRRRGRSGNLRDNGGGGTNGAGIPNGRVVADCSYDRGHTKRPRGKTQVSDGVQRFITRVEQAGRIVAGGYLKEKDLCMIPNRLAIALQDDGWWVRAENVWGKPNPMPDSSGKYRPSTAHEKVWLLTKSAKSHYDALAVKMPVSGNTNLRVKSVRDVGGLDVSDGAFVVPERVQQNPKAAAPNSGIKANTSFQAATTARVEDRYLRNYEPDLSPIVPLTVWRIATAAYADAHFATFPPALVVPCVLAGCPVDGVVLDPFGGAGTTALVAQALGRSSILIERSEEYAAMAVRRVKNGNLGFGLDE